MDKNFRIEDGPIMQPVLVSTGSGATVVFEGKVRDNHLNRDVVALEYEVFDEMALIEGEKLLGEAVDRFGLLEAKAVHRKGRLKVGETAVWIAVSSPHRREAFAGCEFIIDELKKRVPIWKKEHYVEGDSGWISTDETGSKPDYNPA